MMSPFQEAASHVGGLTAAGVTGTTPGANNNETVGDVRSGTGAEVAVVSAAGEVTRIRQDDGGDQGQAGGAYDGRFAVWKDYPTPQSLDLFTVWMWDRDTGKLAKIGGSRGPTDNPFPSAWADPVMGSGHATWIEGVDATGASRVQVVDLETGSVWTAWTGHPTPGAIVGTAIVWGEGPSVGAPNVARAVDLATHQATTPPAALDHEQGLFSLASDGSAMAWVVQADATPAAGAGSTTSTVRHAASPTAQPRSVYAVTIGGFNPPLTVAGEVVVGTQTEGSFVASGANGSAYTLTDIFGIRLRGDSIQIAQDPKADKGAHTRRVIDVSLASLQPAAC